MRRSDYRQARKIYEHEKNTHSHPMQYNQNTEEFNRQAFQKACQEKLRSTNFQDLDTNEIFFETQKKRQWSWSSPTQSSKRWGVIFLVLIALILAWIVGPMIMRLFNRMVHFSFSYLNF